MKIRTSDYSKISSFEDFRLEKEKLALRKELSEARLKLGYNSVVRVFSISNLVSSIIKELVLPRISEILGILLKRLEKKVSPENETTERKENL
jgi:hypothetical protein